MKERFLRFMVGRYGIDTFAKFTIYSGMILLILSSLFTGHPIIRNLYMLSWLLIFYSYFRVFSRNIQKRYAENQWFLARTSKIRASIQGLKSRLLQSKTHHIYRCPSCKQKIRIPKGKGKIEIRCPKCGTTFVKKS